MSTVYRLGKTPARVGAVSLHFADYVRPHRSWPRRFATRLSASLPLAKPFVPPAPPAPPPRPLPVIPASFGLANLPVNWGVQGNSTAGDCVEAGAVHETLRWTLDGQGTEAPFAADAALDLYETWTGYNPADPSSDQGTDMTVAAQNRQSTGITDAAGKVHKIGAYVALTAGDTVQLAQSTYIFGVTGVGVNFPQQWMDAFNAGQPWDRVSSPDLVGGHYVPVIGRRPNGNFVAVTWGALVDITPAGYRQFNDEALAYVSADYLGGAGKTPDGFDFAQLNSDLQDL